jgi:hypothetical protein
MWTETIETGYKYKNIYNYAKLKELITNDINEAILNGYLPKKLKFTIRQEQKYGIFTVNVKSCNINLMQIIKDNIMKIINSHDKQIRTIYYMNNNIIDHNESRYKRIIEFPRVDIIKITNEPNYEIIRPIPYYLIDDHIANLPAPPAWL